MGRSARILVAGLLILGSRAGLGQISSSYDANPDGSYTYHFQVDNSAGASAIMGWSLGLVRMDWDPTDLSLGGDVTVPGNWVALPGIPVGTPFAQDFLSLDPAFDVLPAGTLDGFSFTSLFGPGLLPYTVFGSDGSSSGGQVIGPLIPAVGIIPESSFSGLAAGVAALLMVWVRVGATRAAARNDHDRSQSQLKPLA